MRSITLPSVLEINNSPIVGVTKSKLDGLKIIHNEENYIVGNLALSEGASPHKIINCSPGDYDYDVLFKAALSIIHSEVGERPLAISTGFPFSTYEMNKGTAMEYVKSINEITINSETFGGKGYEKHSPNIKEVYIMPELLASTLAVRQNESHVKLGGVFIVSLGYGTLEIGMSTNSGFTRRTFNSGPGLRYAVKNAMEMMESKYYLGMRNEHQFDKSFLNGFTTIRRNRVDISEIRRESLSEYYRDIISPLIRNTWTDIDFEKSNTLVLVGGGALYQDLIDRFNDEFDGILSIVVPEDALNMASIGYAQNSFLNVQKSHINEDIISVGIDIGNANTVITFVDK